MDHPYAESVEHLCSSAESLPRIVDDAIAGTATYAAALSELVQNLDARRVALNEWAESHGMAPLPDVVTASVPSSDAVRARLIAAARRGAAETAVGLGEAAQRPACQSDATTNFTPGTDMDGAARAAAALLTWTHHEVEGVGAADLVAGTDPVQTAVLLAGLALDLAAKVMPEDGAVAEWIASLGTAWALDGD